MPEQGIFRRLRRAPTQAAPDAPGIFRVDTVGQDGIDDALAEAVALRGETLDGDVLVTGDTAYDQIQLGGSLGNHQVPFTLGVVDRSLCTGFVSADPVAAGIPDWTYNSAGAPDYTVVGEQLVLSATTSGARAEIRWSPGQPDKNIALVLDGLECTGATHSVVIQLLSWDGVGQILSLRNQSNTWESRTDGGGYSGMSGQSTLTPSRLEVLFDYTQNTIWYRWGSSGAWTVKTVYDSAFATTRVFLARAQYSGGAATLKIKSLLCAAVG